MSLLPAERIHIAVGGEDAAWRTEVRRGTVDTACVHLGPMPSSGDAWQAWLRPLADALHKLPVRRRVIDCVVSNSFARFAVAPWEPSAISEDERMAVAHMAITPLVGSAAGAWELRLSPAHYGRTSLVCGLPRALKSALDEIADGVGARLRSLTPLLSSLEGVMRPALSSEGAVLLCVEGDDVLALAMHRREVRWVRRLSSREGIEGILAAVRRQQLIYGAEPAADLAVHLVQYGSALLIPTDAGWQPVSAVHVPLPRGLACAMLESHPS